jgi:hypothetical protein
MSTKTTKGRGKGKSRLVDDVLNGAAEVSPGTAVDVSEVCRQTVDETWGWIEKLRQADDPPHLYRNGDALALYRRPRDGEPASIVGADLDRLAGWLNRNINFVRLKGKYQQTVRTHAPIGLVKALLNDPEPPVSLPRLTGLVDVPPIGPDWSMGSDPAPGYVKSTGHIYMTSDVRAPLGCEEPTPDMVQHAADFILYDMLGQFPFVGSGDRANALGLFLLPFIRHLIPGAVPPHLLDSSKAGSGKGLLRRCLLYPALGDRGLAGGVELTEGEEIRKSITARLLSRAPVFCMDNINKMVASGAFASAVTEPVWTDRILGVSRDVSLPMNMIFVLVGNNVTLSGENARRIVRIRLEPNTEAPERLTFKIADLDGWLRHNRSELVECAYILIRNWVTKGKPAAGADIPAKGSFAEWRRIIGGIIGAAMVEGFLCSDLEFQHDNDELQDELAGFVRAWWAMYGTENKNVRELVQAANTAQLRLKGVELDERAEALGYRLRHLKGQVFAPGFKVCHGRDRASKWWTLQWVGERGKAPETVGEPPSERLHF